MLRKKKNEGVKKVDDSVKVIPRSNVKPLNI